MRPFWEPSALIFPFPKFILNSTTIYSNVSSVARTRLETESDKKLYLKSFEALAFGQHGHEVPYNDYVDHYNTVFDLTSKQQAFHNYSYPELTNGSIYFNLRFSAQLTKGKEIFFVGENFSTICIDCYRKVLTIIFLNTKLETER